MRLRIRLLLVVLAGLFHRWRRGPCAVLDESVLSLRVLPTDVDLTRVTNDRYHALLDLGRVDLGLRIGFVHAMASHRWAICVQFVTLRYRHPLRVLQGYRLRTRIVGWDETALWARQEFERGGRATAVAITKLAFYGAGGVVPMSAVLAAAGQLCAAPPGPPLVDAAAAMDAALRFDQTDVRPATTPAVAPATAVGMPQTAGRATGDPRGSMAIAADRGGAW